MRILLLHKAFLIKKCFIGGDFRNLNIVARIWKEENRKFLWFKLKPKYGYSIFVPYIKKPFYDGEFDTNKNLQVYEDFVRDFCKNKIEEFKLNETNKSTT